MGASGPKIDAEARYLHSPTDMTSGSAAKYDLRYSANTP